MTQRQAYEEWATQYSISNLLDVIHCGTDAVLGECYSGIFVASDGSYWEVHTSEENGTESFSPSER